MSDRPGLPVPREAPKAGFEPPKVDDPTLLNIHDYERAALERLSEQARSYYLSGSFDERTLRDNRAAFSRRHLLPRVMTDTSVIDTSVTILGRRWPSPLFTCPTALHRLAHPDGELATARATAARDVTMTLSTSASTDMAEVAAVGGPRWEFPGNCLLRQQARPDRAGSGYRLRGAGDDRRPAAARPARA